MKKVIALIVVVLFALSITVAFAQTATTPAKAPAAKTTKAPVAKTPAAKTPAAKTPAKVEKAKPVEITIMSVKMGKDKKTPESFVGKMGTKEVTVMVDTKTKMEKVTLKKGEKVMAELGKTKDGKDYAKTIAPVAKKAEVKKPETKKPETKKPETKTTPKK